MGLKGINGVNGGGINGLKGVKGINDGRQEVNKGQSKKAYNHEKDIISNSIGYYDELRS